MLKELFCKLGFGKKVKFSEPKKVSPERRNLPIPRRDDDVDVWRRFVQQEDWTLIYAVYCHFVPRADVPYWEHNRAIHELLCERLLGFEYPVLPEWFLTKNKPLIIWVNDNAAVEQVKSKVRNCYAEKSSPWYVVEKSGRLRGFALSADLIIAGVTPIAVFPHYLLETVERLGVSLLSRADSRFVEKYRPALIAQMREAEVPSLEKVCFWMLALKKGQAGDPYECYDLERTNRRYYIEHDDFSVLLGKL